MLNDVRCVVFDVGETLVDETRLWTSVAHRCGVPVATVCGVLGGLVESGEHHGQLREVLGVDRYLPPFVIESSDRYPNAADCIDSARRHHLRVGIAGNQPEGFDEQLSAAGVLADFIGSSTPRESPPQPSSTSVIGWTTTSCQHAEQVCVPPTFAAAPGVTSTPGTPSGRSPTSESIR